MIAFRRHAIVYTLSGILVAACMVWPVERAGAAIPKVTKVTLVGGATGLELSIDASGPVRYQLINVKPNWIVIDVLGAELGLPSGKLPLVQSPVVRVRVGQFMSNVVRVVVELSAVAQAHLAVSPDGTTIVIGIPAAHRATAAEAHPKRVGVSGVLVNGAPAVHASGSAMPVQASPASQTGDATRSGYVLQIGDVLEVTVWGYPDLTRSVVIRPDGKIALPLAGDTVAAGVSVEALTRELAKTYSIYIKNPQVAVIVKELGKISISVLGEVTHPGTYSLPSGARLMDALAAAGGATETADLRNSQLFRQGLPSQTVDLQTLLSGRSSGNFPLRGGETLVVPQDLTDLVSVLGQVSHPGRYRLQGQMHVLDAIAIAGGLTNQASLTQARLIRATTGESQPIDLGSMLIQQDLSGNVLLEPGDVLSIPEDTTSYIYVMGDVNHAGVFPLKGAVTMLQAIAMAGGAVQRGVGTAKTASIIRRTETQDLVTAQAQAPGERVSLLPKGGGVVIAMDLRKAMDGAIQDQQLRPGDVVVVAQTSASNLPLLLNIVYTILFGIHL